MIGKENKVLFTISSTGEITLLPVVNRRSSMWKHEAAVIAIWNPETDEGQICKNRFGRPADGEAIDLAGLLQKALDLSAEIKAWAADAA